MIQDHTIIITFGKIVTIQVYATTAAGIVNFPAVIQNRLVFMNTQLLMCSHLITAQTTAVFL